MDKYQVVITEDGQVIFLLYQRGNLWLGVGINNDVWSSRFDINEIPNPHIRPATTEEFSVVLDKLITLHYSDDADGF